MKSVNIDESRLLFELTELKKIGLGDDGGQYRLAFSREDLDGRTLVEGFMEEAGMSVTRDGALNSVGRYEGSEPGLKPLVIGSHTDTVPCGGNYDGVLGVLSGIAVVRALSKAGARLRHPLEVINFTGEEAVAPGGTFGSRVLAGGFHDELLDQTVYTGQSFRELLVSRGVDPVSMKNSERKRGDVAAYVELHIEQGGILDREGTPVGVVDGIVGFRRYRVIFPGEANHAGTTPMNLRDDALVKGAVFIQQVQKTAESLGIVGTVGTIEISPGAANVIPERCELTFEIRGLDDQILDRAEAELRQTAEGYDAQWTEFSHKPPVLSDPLLVEALKAGCDEAKLSCRVMPSGAGHDANLMALIAPVAMLFVPNERGISHSKDEYSSPGDVINGARALLKGIGIIDSRIE